MERYLHGTRLRCFVVGVRKGLKGPRSPCPGLTRTWCANCSPWKFPRSPTAVWRSSRWRARPGIASKVAVRSGVSGLNAKGACIGPMGQRVRAVVNELRGEKIDIVDHSEDLASFVASALSPARVLSATVIDEATRAVRVIVPDYQLSLAIGREGQNARLAAKLTGAKIDIRPDVDPVGETARGDVRAAEEARLRKPPSSRSGEQRIPGDGANDSGVRIDPADVSSDRPKTVPDRRGVRLMSAGRAVLPSCHVAEASSEGMRTCVGCRDRDARSVLLRVVAAEVAASGPFSPTRTTGLAGGERRCTPHRPASPSLSVVGHFPGHCAGAERSI